MIKLAKLVVKVQDSASGALLSYVHVDVDGLVLTTGLDGVAIFDVPIGSTKTVKVRQIAYRPYTKSVQITQDRTPLTVSMEKATL